MTADIGEARLSLEVFAMGQGEEQQVEEEKELAIEHRFHSSLRRSPRTKKQIGTRAKRIFFRMRGKDMGTLMAYLRRSLRT